MSLIAGYVPGTLCYGSVRDESFSSIFLHLIHTDLICEMACGIQCHFMSWTTWMKNVFNAVIRTTLKKIALPCKNTTSTRLVYMSSSINAHIYSKAIRPASQTFLTSSLALCVLHGRGSSLHLA